MATKSFPKKIQDADQELVVRFMDADDRTSILALTQRMTESDLWFMRRDLTQPEEVDRWINDIERSRAVTLLAEHGGKIVAYGSLYHNQLEWNRHLAEVRIMVTSAYRNRGIGGTLAHELMLVASELGFEKVYTYTTVEHKGAQKMLDKIGFKPEAILADWIKTNDNRNLDLVIMSASLAGIKG